MANNEILSIPPDDNPIILTRNGKFFASSVDVAQHFEKKHKNVLRAIKNLRSQVLEAFCQLNFELTGIDVIVPSSGGIRKDPAYLITRDGFAMLAMGFTGKKAGAWKEKYIAAFNTMEAKLLDLATSNELLLGVAAGHLAKYPPERRILIIRTIRLCKEYTQKVAAEMLGVTINVVSHIIRKHKPYLVDLPLATLERLEAEVIYKHGGWYFRLLGGHHVQ